MTSTIKSTAFVFFMSAIMSATSLYAEGGNELPSAPRVKNYREVVSQFEYPDEYRKHANEGHLTMRFLVSESGKVLKVQVLNSDDQQLSAACIKHLSKFEFEPARDAQGDPMATWVKMPVTFRQR